MVVPSHHYRPFFYGFYWLKISRLLYQTYQSFIDEFKIRIDLRTSAKAEGKLTVRIIQCVKQFFVQKFIAQAAVERLDETIFWSLPGSM